MIVRTRAPWSEMSVRMVAKSRGTRSGRRGVGDTWAVQGSRMRAGRVGTLRRVLGRAPASRRLVISYLFPPAAETSGLVVAKRIHSWGLPVDVIASEAPAGREPDPGAVTVAGPTVGHVVRLKGRRNKLADWQNVE